MKQGEGKIEENLSTLDHVRDTCARLKGLVENASAGLAFVDKDYRYAEISNSFARTSGVSVEVNLGRKVWELTPELWPAMEPPYTDVLEKGVELRNIEVTGRASTASGESRNWLVDYYPVRSSRGEILGIGIQVCDITERKQTEKALRASEEWFRNVYMNSNIGSYRTTPDGKILLANKAIMRLLGYDSFKEITGRNLEEEGFEPGYDRASFKEQIERDGEIAGLESTWKKRDGSTIHVRESAKVVRAEDGSTLYYEGLVEDITKQRKLEQQLIQAQKMETVGRLTGGIAHDFNNILTTIIGQAKLMEMALGRDDPSMAKVESILSSSERAAQLTRDLLAFSRQQPSCQTSLDLNEIVRKVEPMLSRVVEADIELRVVEARGVLTIMADSSQVEQILVNLCTNSCDAMPDGGVLAITTGIIGLDDTFMEKHGYGRKGTFAILKISDTGRGMDETAMGRIFEPFFTTKEKAKGSGLGLSIVDGLVQQHNGFIHCSSAPGSGTTFEIYFPTISSEKSAGPGLRESMELTGGTETILLAEDDESVRDLNKEVLETAGYTVIEAVNGADAIRKFFENKSRINLLLFDLIMPVLGGMEAFEIIDRGTPGIKALFTSGYSRDNERFTEIFKRGYSFAPKPTLPGDLLKLVRQSLDKKT